MPTILNNFMLSNMIQRKSVFALYGHDHEDDALFSIWRFLQETPDGERGGGAVDSSFQRKALFAPYKTICHNNILPSGDSHAPTRMIREHELSVMSELANGM